ncbi:MAG: hypothetical protein QM820_61395 [Minicystis sp.]
MSQKNNRPRVAREADKGSLKARENRSDLIEGSAPSSPIWQAQQPVQAAGKRVIAAGASLAAGEKLLQILEAQVATQRQLLVSLTAEWDEAHRLYATNVESFAIKPEDVTALGLPVLDKGTYALAAPIAVTAKFDAKADLLRIQVQRPPGKYTCRIEISPNPIGPDTFKEVKGHGARRALSGYAPGGYWVRAAMVDAGNQSDFTKPVFVVVK